LATHAHIFTVTDHCALGSTVQLYAHPKPLIVPLPIVTSVDMKLNTVSLNAADTVNVVFVHDPTPDVNVTPGAIVSIFMSLLYHNDHAANKAGNIKLALFHAASLILHQSSINALIFV
jgi:hypothetical protein